MRLLLTALSMLTGLTLTGAAPPGPRDDFAAAGSGSLPALVTPGPAPVPTDRVTVSAGPYGEAASPALTPATDEPVPPGPFTGSATAAAGGPRAGPLFSWPLDPPHPVLRPFEAPTGPYGPGHRGVDLGGTPGQPVRAAAAGTVVFTGHVAGRGVVSVAHADGLRTTYEPVTPAVSAGQHVTTGELLGQLTPGHPGCAAAACLHWGLRRGGEYLDPLGLLSTGRVRLLPWDD